MRSSNSGVLASALGYASERAVSLLLGAAVGVVVARYLGPAEFGLLSYVSGVFGLLAPLTLLGMPSLLVREFSTSPNWREVLTSAFVRQGAAAAAAAIIGLLVVGFTRRWEPDATMLAIALLPLPLLGLSRTFRAYLEATNRVRPILITGVSAAVVASALRLTGVMAHAPTWVFGALVSVEAAVVFLGLARAVPGSKHPRGARRHYRPDVARRLTRESWPLLLSSIAVAVYMRADIIMLGALAGDTDVGLYTAAARLSEVWYFLPTAALAAVRPRLARAYIEGREMDYDTMTRTLLAGSLWVALAAAAVVATGAPAFVRLVYGAEFGAAADVLRVHVLAAPFVFLGVGGSQWFIDRGLTRRVMARSVVGAAVNIALNVVLIPTHGAVGASIATLVAYALSGVLLNVVTRETRSLFWLQAGALAFRGVHWRQSTPGRHGG